MTSDPLSDPFTADPLPPVPAGDPAAAFLNTPRPGRYRLARVTVERIEYERDHGDPDGRDEHHALHRYEQTIYGP